MSFRRLSTLLFPAIAILCLAVSPAFAAQSNKWRLQFSGAAESAGEMVFEIAPAGEPPVRVTVAIERNDGENRVARKVKTAIDRQAGRWVDAELDDGEDVLVKRHFFRRFSIALVSSTVKDVRINFDRE
jgi:phage tail sheath gpL-like